MTTPTERFTILARLMGAEPDTSHIHPANRVIARRMGWQPPGQRTADYAERVTQVVEAEPDRWDEIAYAFRAMADEMGEFADLVARCEVAGRVRGTSAHL